MGQESLKQGNNIACPVCASTGNEPVTCIFEGLLKCGTCGFIFAGPDAPTETNYEEDFGQTLRHPTYEYVQGAYRVRNINKLNALIDRLEPYRKLNRMVDVGCSAAFFLKLAMSRGWRPLGVEISDFGVNFSRDELGIEMFQGMLEDANIPSDSVDVVCSSHVMEHVANPASLLAEAKRILRPGGALLTVVPTQFRSASYLLKNDLPGEGPPRHVSYYSRSNYNRLLESQGFRVVYSTYNTELKRLQRAFKNAAKSSKTGSLPVIPAPKRESDGGKEVKARPIFTAATPEQSGPTLLAKSLINRVCTMMDVGDELVQIAVKPVTINGA